MGTLLRRINLRHTTGKKLRTLLTIGGIGAGVALLFSISVLNATLLSSFRSSIRDLAGSAELEVSAADPAGLPANLVKRVAAVQGVDRAVPALRSTTTVTGARGSERIVVLGITPEFASLFPREGPFGRVDLEGGFGPRADGLLMAGPAAERLGLATGDTAALETPAGTRPVSVTGQVSGGPVSLLNGGEIGIMLLPAAQDVFGRGGRVDSIYVAPDPDIAVDDVDAALEEVVGGGAVVGPPGERGQGLERVFSSLATLLSMGGTVALFVSLFVVYNTMAMSLAERRREISMVIALGADRRSVFGAFLAEALVVGVISSILGVLGGLWLADSLVERAADDFRIFSITATGPITVPGSALMIALVGGLAVSIAGAYVPARRVLRVAPIESLRPVAAYEWDASPRGFGSPVMVAGGFIGILLSAAFLIAFLLAPEQRWIVTVGLLFGLAGVSLLLPRIVPFGIAVLRPLLRKVFGTVGRLAADALAKNPGRSTFTVAALVLTLGLVVGVAGALSSYESQIEKTATALIGAPIYVTSKSFTGLISDQPLRGELEQELEKVEGVRFVYPLRFALLDLGDEQGLIYAIDVDSALTEGATSQMGAITSDPEAFVQGLGRGEINVSRLAAERLGVEAGDRIVLPTPSGRAEFRVAAVFDDLLSFSSFYLDIETYRELWRDDKADEFGILLEDDAAVDTVQARLEEVIASSGAPAVAYEKEELVARLLAVVGGTFELARGVQLAALVVAALTILNTMFTTVLERRWEMGLERALGMDNRLIGRTVLLEAAGIGLIGGIGGVILGVVTGFFMTQAMEAEFTWRVPFQLPLDLLAAAVLGGTVLAGAAGLVPSRVAVRTPIIESLRYE